MSEKFKIKLSEQAKVILKNVWVPALSVFLLLLGIIFRFALPENVRIGAAFIFFVITMIVSLLALLQQTRKNLYQRLLLAALVISVVLLVFQMINVLDLGADATPVKVAFDYVFLALFSLTVVGVAVYSTIIGIMLENAIEPVED
ncbi:MAG: hypothetical protein QM205_00150 [Bacillota bacterium]|jgi:hypothetical protein|nr:hypothetical protein [Bacillota bacterium]MDY0118877.1 hypothetical protein [Bacilli bacterium]